MLVFKLFLVFYAPFLVKRYIFLLEFVCFNDSDIICVGGTAQQELVNEGLDLGHLALG